MVSVEVGGDVHLVAHPPRDSQRCDVHLAAHPLATGEGKGEVTCLVPTSSDPFRPLTHKRNASQIAHVNFSDENVNTRLKKRLDTVQKFMRAFPMLLPLLMWSNRVPAPINKSNHKNKDLGSHCDQRAVPRQPCGGDAVQHPRLSVQQGGSDAHGQADARHMHTHSPPSTPPWTCSTHPCVLGFHVIASLKSSTSEALGANIKSSFTPQTVSISKSKSA